MSHEPGAASCAFSLPGRQPDGAAGAWAEMDPAGETAQRLLLLRLACGAAAAGAAPARLHEPGGRQGRGRPGGIHQQSEQRHPPGRGPASRRGPWPGGCREFSRQHCGEYSRSGNGTCPAGAGECTPCPRPSRPEHPAPCRLRHGVEPGQGPGAQRGPLAVALGRRRGADAAMVHRGLPALWPGPAPQSLPGDACGAPAVPAAGRPEAAAALPQRRRGHPHAAGAVAAGAGAAGAGVFRGDAEKHLPP